MFSGFALEGVLCVVFAGLWSMKNLWVCFRKIAYDFRGGRMLNFFSFWGLNLAIISRGFFWFSIMTIDLCKEQCCWTFPTAFWDFCGEKQHLQRCWCCTAINISGIGDCGVLLEYLTLQWELCEQTPAAAWGCIDLNVVLDCIQNIFAEQFFAVGCVLQEDSGLCGRERFTLVTD